MCSKVSHYSAPSPLHDNVRALCQKLRSSLGSTKERDFEAGSVEEKRFAPDGETPLILEASKKTKRINNMEFQTEFFQEQQGNRNLYFSCIDMDGELISQKKDLLPALAQWAGKKNTQDAFSFFALSQPLSLLQILLGQDCMSPLTPEEEKCVAQLSKDIFLKAHEQIFEIEKTEIKLHKEHIIDVTWTLKLNLSGEERYVLSQNIEIVPKEQGQGACQIKMTRALVFAPQRKTNSLRGPLLPEVRI